MARRVFLFVVYMQSWCCTHHEISCKLLSIITELVYQNNSPMIASVCFVHIVRIVYKIKLMKSSQWSTVALWIEQVGILQESIFFFEEILYMESLICIHINSLVICTITLGLYHLCINCTFVHLLYIYIIRLFIWPLHLLFIFLLSLCVGFSCFINFHIILHPLYFALVVLSICTIVLLIQLYEKVQLFFKLTNMYIIALVVWGR